MLAINVIIKLYKKEYFHEAKMHCPGIEPGSKAWKALMITTTLAMLSECSRFGCLIRFIF